MEVILTFDNQLNTSNSNTNLEDANAKSEASFLIVEDNDVNQLITSKHIDKIGGVYKVANNGAEAIEVLKTEKFDLILMDLQMPVMDGWEATKVIINDMAIDTPIVACSAFSTDEEKAKCLELGMREYLCKPFDTDKLLMLCEKYLEKSISQE